MKLIKDAVKLNTHQLFNCLKGLKLAQFLPIALSQIDLRKKNWPDAFIPSALNTPISCHLCSWAEQLHS